jgi:hypothetical protein
MHISYRDISNCPGCFCSTPLIMTRPGIWGKKDPKGDHLCSLERESCDFWALFVGVVQCALFCFRFGLLNAIEALFDVHLTVVLYITRMMVSLISYDYGKINSSFLIICLIQLAFSFSILSVHSSLNVMPRLRQNYVEHDADRDVEIPILPFCFLCSISLNYCYSTVCCFLSSIGRDESFFSFIFLFFFLRFNNKKKISTVQSLAFYGR